MKEKKFKERFSGIAGFNKSPLNSVLSSIHFEMKSNREVIIEGCQGIAEYDENIVKINFKKMVVSFYGRNLEIKCLNSDSLVIEGFITSIEFIT